METLFSPQPTASSTSSAEWKPPAATSPGRRDPKRSAWILAQAKQVFGSYRKDDFADPDSFLAQLGMILERYSDDIIAKACHPVTGIQRVYRTPPSMAAIAEFCDDESERLARIRQMATLRRQEPAPRPIGQNRANVFVPADSPCYPAMLERARNADPLNWRKDAERAGLWVALSWLDNKTEGRTWRRPTGEELMAMYPEPAPQEPAA